MELLRHWYQTLKELITRPDEFYSIESEYTGLEFPIKYLLISSAAFAVIGSTTSLIWSLISGNASLGRYVSSLFIMFLSTPVIFAISGLTLHISTNFLGAKKAMQDASKIVIYTSGILFIAGWLPVINFILGLYIIYLWYRGLKIVYRLSESRSIIAVALTVILGVVLPLGILSVVTKTPFLSLIF